MSESSNFDYVDKKLPQLFKYVGLYGQRQMKLKEHQSHLRQRVDKTKKTCLVELLGTALAWGLPLS